MWMVHGNVNTYIVVFVSTSGHSLPNGHGVHTVWFSREYVPGSHVTSIFWLVIGQALWKRNTFSLKKKYKKRMLIKDQ